jgi:hypothetical protein
MYVLFQSCKALFETPYVMADYKFHDSYQLHNKQLLLQNKIKNKEYLAVWSRNLF